MMGTIVTIEVVEDGSDEAIERAFEWFREIERLCNRFDSHSALRQLTAHPGVARPAGEILYAAVEFALAVAEETGGAFDPTVGHQMETRGFNRDYRTGHIVDTALRPDGPVSYRDVHLDPERRTVTLLRPLVLDLGAVAKGLAIDMAARELDPFENYAIDAGGDLYLAGHNAGGEPWSVGIHHPRRDREVIECLRVSNAAVCTSGDYERQGSGDEAGHHLMDPRSGKSADAVVSATVVAPTAMLADALATAAFVLGPDQGIRLLERHGVDGLLVSPTLERFATRGMRSEYSLDRAATSAAHRGPAVLPNT
jgi:thiamine biosynthesis lipoprotein